LETFWRSPGENVERIRKTAGRNEGREAGGRFRRGSDKVWKSSEGVGSSWKLRKVSEISGKIRKSPERFGKFRQTPVSDR
jgi:hypothetical protein